MRQGKQLFIMTAIIVATILCIVPLARSASQEEANKEFAGRWVKEIWDKQNMDLVPEFVADDFELDDPLGAFEVRGVEAVGPWIGGWLKSFPDWVVDTRSLVAEGEYIGVYMWVGGTFKLDYKEYGLDIPANNLWKPRGTLDIWHIVDGKIAFAWMSYDTIIFLQNISSLPPQLGPLVDTVYDETLPRGENQRDLHPKAVSDAEKEANKALLNRLKDRLNAHNLENIGDIFAPDVAFHAVGQPEAVDNSGLQGINELLNPLLTAIPDLTITFERVISDGNMIVVRWAATGTSSGEFHGIPGTGNKIDTGGNAMLRFENGKIAEIWNTARRLQLMQQLGVFPAPQS